MYIHTNIYVYLYMYRYGREDDFNIFLANPSFALISMFLHFRIWINQYISRVTPYILGFQIH